MRIRQARQTRMRRGDRTTRTNARVSHPSEIREIQKQKGGPVQEIANQQEEATTTSQGAGIKQTEESSPFGRTGPELPGDYARAEGNSRAGA